MNYYFLSLIYPGLKSVKTPDTPYLEKLIQNLPVFPGCIGHISCAFSGFVSVPALTDDFAALRGSTTLHLRLK